MYIAMVVKLEWREIMSAAIRIKSCLGFCKTIHAIKRGDSTLNLVALTKKCKTIIMALVVVLAFVLISMFFPAKANAETTMRYFPIGSTSAKVYCGTSPKTCYYFDTSENINLRITINHQTFDTNDSFMRVGIAKNPPNTLSSNVNYATDIKDGQSLIGTNDVAIPAWLPTTIVTFTNLDPGRYYIDLNDRDGQGYKHAKSKNAWYTISTTDVIPFSDFKVSVGKNRDYTGKPLKIKPNVSLYGKKMKLDEDYKIVSYKNNKNVGKATVKLQGLGKYKGTKTVSFRIVPRKVAIKAPSSGNDRVTVKWQKAIGADGYQIRYSSGETVRDIWKGKNVTQWKKWGSPRSATNIASQKVFKLKDKTKYRFQVRAFTIIDGKKVYGKWSNTKVKTTK